MVGFFPGSPSAMTGPAALHSELIWKTWINPDRDARLARKAHIAREVASLRDPLGFSPPGHADIEPVGSHGDRICRLTRLRAGRVSMSAGDGLLGSSVGGGGGGRTHLWPPIEVFQAGQWPPGMDKLGKTLRPSTTAGASALPFPE